MADTAGISKAQKRLLRQLAGQPYEAELRRELESLEGEFAKWRAGDIDSFELNDRVHRYHNGVAREVWKRYQAEDEASLRLQVGFAVASGLLEAATIPAELEEPLRPVIQAYRELNR